MFDPEENSDEVTPALLRRLIEAEQRALLEEIAECYEEIVAWQEKAEQLQKRLTTASDRTINEWLGGLAKPAVA